ncbi:amino acid permease [Clostridium sp. P21]|uniref:Amino acid permease n=1 Tax=Clostridium muellerianum TaxID=2716538 RepID=A0A7Y0EHB5_9CLOT|nr:amino acid permease [Clostridium muellerianum]NMM63382.1 amino acid permease [Clostridium muellerianum]
MGEKVKVKSLEKEELKRDLKNRHLQMISIGGAIGTGLFYGASSAIKAAGPAIILTYVFAGIAIYFIMRALGELAVAEPVSGSYVSYANRYISRYLGFMLGWSKPVIVVAVSAAELNALGKYVHFWFPQFPIWASALIIVIILFTVNTIGVKVYGEAEFWLSFIKVTAIAFMVIFGILMIFFGVGNHGQPVGFGNIVNNGGFFPNGIQGILVSVSMAAFAYGGVEDLGLAAGEVEDADKSIPKAINAVFWRILIFYVGAIVVLVILFPWSTMGSSGSPFVEVFSRIGIPAAASVINFVVIIAAVSTLNASIFVNSRVIYNLALQKNAPAFLGKVNNTKVPQVAVMFIFCMMLVGVVINYLLPEQAFTIFSSIVVFSITTCWAVILISHLKFRRIKIMNNEVHTIKYLAPFYPYGDYLGLVFLVIVIGCMTLRSTMRVSFIVAGTYAIIAYIAYKFYTKKEST